MSPSTSRPSARRASTRRRDLARARSPPFWGSPPRFTSTSTRAPGARRAISAPSSARSTDCQHRDPRRERAHLVALQLPEEVPARRAAATGAFASSSWARFSPRSTTPAATTACDPVDGDGLGRGDERAPSPDRARRGPRRPRCARAPRRRAPATSADGVVHVVRTTTTAWRPVTPSRRWEKWSGDADGAHADVGDVVDPGARRARRAPRRGCRAPGAPSAVRPATSGPSRVDQPVEEVGAELVARGVDARAEHRATGPGDTARAAPSTAAPMHALLEARPAGVDDADRARRDQRDRRAVGGEHHERQARRSW